MSGVLCVYGTRPEAIKMAPLVRELGRRGLSHKVCVTGQHREMLDQVNHLFGIVPDFDLDLMRVGQTPTEVAARILLELEPILKAERPDWVVVQGDTTSAMAATLAAVYSQVQVAHLEAGLRTGDLHQPFPEEINRLVIGSVASLHLSPTEAAASALLSEGKTPGSVYVTGNTVIDALLWARTIAAERPRDGILSRIDSGRKVILLTAHRRENFGAALDGVFRLISQLAHKRSSEVQIIFPVHPNPQVRDAAWRILAGIENIVLCEPLDYLDMVRVIDASFLVITDSGGIQEEAPALGKPVLVLRETTERPEANDAGVARLVGTDPALIRHWIESLLDDPSVYTAMSRGSSPYGDGHAAERSVAAMLGEQVSPYHSGL